MGSSSTGGRKWRWHLRSLYMHLDEWVANVAPLLGHYNVVSHMDSNILHIFLWERSRLLNPNLLSILLQHLVRLDEWSARGDEERISVTTVSALRWVGVQQSGDKSLARGIDKEENFNFRA